MNVQVKQLVKNTSKINNMNTLSLAALQVVILTIYGAVSINIFYRNKMPSIWKKKS